MYICIHIYIDIYIYVHAYMLHNYMSVIMMLIFARIIRDKPKF
jgi:hypothetical protein